MKKYTVYECEICRARYRKAAEAKECEETHTVARAVTQIVECHFDPTGNLAIPEALRKSVPTAVTVRFGPGDIDVAKYHLTKVGP